MRKWLVFGGLATALGFSLAGKTDVAVGLFVVTMVVFFCIMGVRPRP